MMPRSQTPTMDGRGRAATGLGTTTPGAPLPAVLLALIVALPSWASAQQVEPESSEQRGFIGFGLRPTVSCQWSSSGSGARARTPDSSACERAVLCETIVVDGPADRAGIRPGDVLLEIEGRPVLTEDGRLDLPVYPPGEPIVLTVRRDGERRRFEVVPEERPDRPSVMPVKALRQEVALTAPSPEAPEAAERPPSSWVVRLAPVASAPLPPTVQVRSGEGGTFVLQAPSGETLDSLLVRARAGSVSTWPGTEAFVTSKSWRAYDSALAEIRPVLDSLRRVQAGELREMITSARDARREQIERHEAQVRELRERQQEVARRAREIQESVQEQVSETMAATEVTRASQMVRLAGGEFLTLSPELAASFEGVDGGLLVTRVLEGFPADELGLKAGDVVVRAGGEAVAGAADLRRALYQLARDGSVEITWVRKGSTLSGTLRK